MRRLLPLLVALVVVSSACGGLGRDVAATVDGTDITVEQVRQLATAIGTLNGAPDDGTTDDVLGGTAARAALAQWVQLEAFHAELESRGEAATAEERSQASQQVDSLDGLSRRNKQRLVTLVASATALGRVVGANRDAPEVPEPTDAEIAAAAEELIAQVPPEQLVLVCSDAIAGPASGADEVQALLDGGAELTDTEAFAETEFVPPSGTNPLCVSIDQLPAELQAPMRDTPVGELARADFTAPAGDQTLFFIPTGPRTLTATDPEVVAAATQQLQDEAQSAAEQQQALDQSETDEEYRKVLRRADIEVDPRFGTFDEGEIVGPLAPLTPVSDEAPVDLPVSAG